ncbi:MAG: AAA family ATPase [Synergistaceae bacterium]|nr:AAA family ATPase [Synergistaceae bacterium]
MAFRKTERRKTKLRLGITGPAGAGKTYGALLIALGLGGKIAMIDTENGSGDFYSELGEYDICNITAPYDVRKYLAAIHEAEDAGYDVIIIDSLSHAWAGDGGLLDMQGRIADSGRANSYTAWRQVTPLHNKLIEAMLTSNAHIIATMRSKTDYAQDKDDKGKTVIRKVGLAPVQRDGLEYEFAIVFNLGFNHLASVSKDRTSLFDGQSFIITPEVGQKLKTWLDTGSDLQLELKPEPDFETRKKNAYGAWLKVLNNNTDLTKTTIQNITNGRPSSDWTEEDLNNIQAAFKEFTNVK